jgi:hypothetical protein
MRSSNPAKLAKLRAEDPVAVLASALGSLGGSADASRLKMFLVGSDLVPAAEWNAFWRKARADAAKDARIDASRSFEQQFRLASPAGAAGAEVEVPLPALEPRKPAKSNLATLRKFLHQHPGADAVLARRFGRMIERYVLDAEGEREDRARAGLHFARWFPQRAAQWTAVLKSCGSRGWRSATSAQRTSSSRCSRSRTRRAWRPTPSSLRSTRASPRCAMRRNASARSSTRPGAR